MNAIVSGRAGVAMILDGDMVASLRAGSGQTTSTCRLEDFHLLFGNSDDLQFLEGVGLSDVADRLADEFGKELALQLVLILLDREGSPRTRRAAAEELKALFLDDRVASFVESVLYAQVLPVDADPMGALACIPGDASRVRAFVDHLRANQGHIAAVQIAWETIPTRIFGGDRELSQARAAAVRAGWFREVVMWRARGAEGTPSLPDLDDQQARNLQKLAQAWIEELRGNYIAEEAPGIATHDDSEIRRLSFVAEGTGGHPLPGKLSWRKS